LFDAILPYFPASAVPGVVFQGCCSWLELAVVNHSGFDERAEFQCRIKHKGHQRDFLGFCRASNAVIEAAILATRLAYYDRKKASEDLNHYMKIVENTGGETDKKAIRLIHDYVRERGQQ
jgi:hypothetical protein